MTGAWKIKAAIHPPVIAIPHMKIKSKKKPKRVSPPALNIPTMKVEFIDCPMTK